MALKYMLANYFLQINWWCFHIILPLPSDKNYNFHNYYNNSNLIILRERYSIIIFSFVPSAEPIRFQQLFPEPRPHRCTWVNLVDHKTKQDSMNVGKGVVGWRKGWKEWKWYKNGSRIKSNQNALSAWISLSKGKINGDRWGKSKGLCPSTLCCDWRADETPITSWRIIGS